MRTNKEQQGCDHVPYWEYITNQLSIIQTKYYRLRYEDNIIDIYLEKYKENKYVYLDNKVDNSICCLYFYFISLQYQHGNLVSSYI